MSLCPGCNGKGRVCDRCGNELPTEFVQDGDNDYCNESGLPKGLMNCWEAFNNEHGRPKQIEEL